MSTSGPSRLAAPEHITPYDRCAWDDTQVEQLLLNGAHAEELSAFFGDTEYQHLRSLARRAHQHELRADATRVFIVPGIMGSQLGLRRPAPTPPDILWLDPIDISVGRLTTLHMNSGAPVIALGVVLYSYLRLKLNLRTRGLHALLHAYDWRLSLDALGTSLAARLACETGRVMIVAHSMGGLISRIALGQPGGERVERLVLLGTPNGGSFAPLQALRGTYAVVRKIARLVTKSSAEMLAEQVFSSFPSLYQMLPDRGCLGGRDFLDAAEWPTSGPRPDVELLARARTVRGLLSPADDRITTIVGIGQETVTAATRRRDDLIYTITRGGDGTVPAVSACLPGAHNYYTRIDHSEMTRDPQVAAAVADVLLRGKTARLPHAWPGNVRAQARISDQALRRLHAGKVDWARLEPDERREFLETLNEPPKLRLSVPRKHPRPIKPRPQRARSRA